MRHIFMEEEPKIIHEDRDLLIIDKPAGWIVNKAQTTKEQPVVQDWLESLDFPLARDEKERSGIVHRLDKETSGVLIVAKNKEALSFLQKQFKERSVKKKYLALVHGKLVPIEGSVDVTVGRLSWDRKKFGVVPGGRESYTDYKVRQYYKNKEETFSLVEYFPKTGRTHQIRIHSKYLNHPIVADEAYAGRKTSKKDRVWCPRLFLHAKWIRFDHPATKKKVEYESKLPPNLVKTLSVLEKQA